MKTFLWLFVPFFSFFMFMPSQDYLNKKKSTEEISEEEFIIDCGSEVATQQAFDQNPQLLQRHNLFEEEMYRTLSGNSAEERTAIDYTIPVVVHIIHNNGSENISDAMVQTGIQHMNDAFANVGYYDQGTGVNVQIQFCLATVDPNYNPTTGINRVVSTLTDMDIGTDDVALKNLSRWDPFRYANIWLVNEISSGGSNGVAGYAYLPGAHGLNIDGMVSEAAYFGSSQGNSTVHIHEMGHYLGLHHTFQDGCTNNNCLTDGDLVCDTPPDNSTAAVFCNDSANSCSTDTNSGFATDQDDMTENYMDYNYGVCLNTFTQGQKDRMQATMINNRGTLANSDRCITPPTCSDGQQNGYETGVDCGGPKCPSCTSCSGTQVAITILPDYWGGETSWELRDASTNLVASGGLYTNSNFTPIVVDLCLPDGCYDFIMNDTYGDGVCCGGGVGSYSVDSEGTNLASGGSFGFSETTNFCVVSNNNVLLSAKTFLNGCYNSGTGMMNDAMRISGVIPTTEPYTGLGYTNVGGGGETINASVLSVTGNNAIVDWIRLELRDQSSNSTVLATRSALIQRDGDIVDVDGTSPVSFAGMSADNYYVVIQHRNHLSIMALNTYLLSSTTTAVDFSTGTATYGTNAQYNNSGTNVMWSGNGNGDGKVVYIGSGSDLSPITVKIYTDPGNVLFDASYPSAGYHVSDYNIDGQTIYVGSGSDISPITVPVYLNPANTNFDASYPLFEQLP